MDTQSAIKRALKREGQRFKRINRYFASAYDYTFEKDKRLEFLRAVSNMPIFIFAYNNFGDYPRGIYMGSNSNKFGWEKDLPMEALHYNLENGLAVVLDPKTKQIMAFEKEVQVRVNEFYWLLIRKKGYSLDY